jgi:nicotinamidase-related amidase
MEGPTKRQSTLGQGVLPALLITQCAQRDYLGLPSSDAHVGAIYVGDAEAKRVRSALCDAVRAARASGVAVLHIRDWHDKERHRDHLNRFGEHCIAGSKGAELIVETAPEVHRGPARAVRR